MNSKRIFFGQQRISFFLYGFMFFSYLMLQGQDQITFRQLSVKEGLSQNSVVSVAQDSIGTLWIATQDGLNKYDGQEFKHFPFQFTDITQPGFSSFGKVFIDKQNRVWIIPEDRKLYRSEPHKLLFEPFPDIKDVYSIYQDDNDNYWIGTTTGILYFLKTSSGSINDVPFDNAEGKTIYQIEKASNNTLFILYDNTLATIDINTQDVNTFVSQPQRENSNISDFSAFTFDDNDGLWISTFGDGLFYKSKRDSLLKRPYESKSWAILPENLNIQDLHFDSKNRLWVATYGDGLYMLDEEERKVHHFEPEKTNPRALHYKDVLCIYEDYLGTVWFGTDGAGLSYFDENLEKFNSFTNYQTPENISIDVVRSLAVSNDNIWIGTSGKGLTSYNLVSENWQTYSTTNSAINSDRVMSLQLDQDGDLWIGTQGNGLSILSESRLFSNYSNNLSARSIWDIFQDKKGRFWLATQNNGLILFDKQTKKEIKYDITIEENGKQIIPSIRVIEQDNSGNFWLGTDQHGLLEYNPETGKTNHIINTDIKAIKSLYSKGNQLWIGTNGNGLIHFNTSDHSFEKYTIENGLPNNVIYAILSDKNNNLWLSSNKGITKFSQESPGRSPVITNYANYDGLATEFNTGAYYKDQKGTLYFGGLEGFYWFLPENIKNNSTLPKTVITGMEVLDKEFPLSTSLQLDYTQNTIAFIFSSMQFSLPEKNKYQYQLLEYDDAWINAGYNNFVRYSQLPPGDYTFQVKSSNYDGVWNDVPATYSFKIRTPWYLSLVAKIGYVLLALVLAFAVYRYMKWRWMMQVNLKLKEDEARKFKKLNKLKSKLYTDIAHEFKTPLTLIAAPLEDKLREPNLSQKDHSNMTMAARNVDRLSDLVDQLLALARLDDGKQKIKLERDDLGLFLHSISELFEYKANQKKINFSKVINVRGLISYDNDIIEKIVTNLLSNAIKYTPEKGVCTFLADHQNDRLTLTVKNDTANANELELDKLFNRFYQFNKDADGAGIGLSLVKKLVKLYKGTIDVSLDDSKKICFNVEIPAVLENSPNKSKKTEKEVPIAVQTPTKEKDFKKQINEELPILLIAEDHHEVRKFVVKTFKDSYQVLDASNGKRGLEMALEHVPDIILSDIQMPLMNGIELCNTLKTDPRTSHIPVILLTAGFDEEVELEGLISGADDYVTKPFKLAVLEQRIANLITTRKTLRDRYSQELILKPKNLKVTSADEKFLNDIQKILDEHLTDPDFTAEKFSEYANMSRMQLHRKLMAFTGLSTSAFIRSQRLKMALPLLENSSQNISEVAYAVGFGTPSYFMKCFKETFNQTPSNYLNSHKK